MKKLFLFCLVISKIISAQDTLILKNNTRILSLILLVGEDSIRYKKLDNIMGPDLYIKNSEVKKVSYKSGKKINVDSLYNSPKVTVPVITVIATQPQDSETVQKMYRKGEDHAELFYKHQGGSVPIGIASVFLTPVTFIPVGVLMFKAPAKKNLGYPSEDLWNNRDYQRGYLDKATGIRRKKIVRSFIAGSIVSHFLVAVIIATAHNSGTK